MEALPSLEHPDPRIREVVLAATNYIYCVWSVEAWEIVNQYMPLLKGGAGGDFVKTFAEKWDEEHGERYLEEGEAKGRAEGEAKGRAEGEARGEAKGKVRGKAEIVLKLLRLRFGDLPEEVKARVAQASLEELEIWIERVLTAESLDAVFAEDS